MEVLGRFCCNVQSCGVILGIFDYFDPRSVSVDLARLRKRFTPLF
jgi:hypothetical protein